MRARSVRNRILAAAVLAVILAPTGVPAHAANKDIIALQTQVQQLMDMVQRIQSTLDSKFGVLQNLADQTADQANKMSVAVSNLQKQLDMQAQAESGKSDALSGQIQSLNDSVDELKTRIAKVDKSLQDLQGQLQQMQMQAQTNNSATAAGATPGSAPAGAPAGMPGAPAGTPAAMPPALNAAPQAPPLESTYQSALRDFNAGRYTVAASEFQDVVHYYPLDDLAGTAQFYLGEIAYQKKEFDKAISDYNTVIENFGGNAKAPAAQLHKAYALIATKRRESGIRELRLLIQRHPQTPEARAARGRLNAMGVRISAR